MARRNPSGAAALDPALTQKKRARRRLVGAVVLGVAAAIVLPLVLDSEPRQTITDVEIEIPPREAALPALEGPKPAEVAIATPNAGAVAEETIVPPAPAEPVPEANGAAQGRPDAASHPRSGSKVEAKADPKPEAAPKAKGDSRTAGHADAEADSRNGPKPSSKTPVARDSAPAAASAASPSASAGASSRAAPAAPSSGTRFALQLGAYANAGSARAQLDKARRTGLRAYTETVNTTQGERTRVRVGPFPTREAAEKARATLKLAGMESAVVDAR